MNSDYDLKGQVSDRGNTAETRRLLTLALHCNLTAHDEPVFFLHPVYRRLFHGSSTLRALIDHRSEAIMVGAFPLLSVGAKLIFRDL